MFEYESNKIIYHFRFANSCNMYRHNINEPPRSKLRDITGKRLISPLTPPSPPERRGEVVTLKQASGNYLD
jgi:hypothetical protein